MEVLTWLLKANLLLVLFFAVYLVFLRRETFFQLNRFFLLGAMLVSLVVPALPEKVEVVSEAAFAQRTFLLPDAVVQASQQVQAWPWNDLRWWAYAYLLVTGLVVARLTWRSMAATRAAAHGRAAFSFLGKVHLGEALVGRERAVILAHEEVHARQWHSLDILLAEIVHAVLWVNPLLPWLKRELRLVHECIADREATRTTDRESYSLLLVSEALGAQPAIAHSFYSENLLKSRITMMYKSPSRRLALVKYAAVLPLIVLMLALQTRVVAQKEAAPKTVEQKDGGPDVMPEYPGGLEAMYKFIGATLKYPEEAQKKGEEGTAIVSFVVKADGTLTNGKIVRSASPALDKEALRIVQSMPKWKPATKDGKAVDAEMNLPVKFVLESKAAPKSEEKAPKAPAEKKHEAPMPKKL